MRTDSTSSLSQHRVQKLRIESTSLTASFHSNPVLFSTSARLTKHNFGGGTPELTLGQNSARKVVTARQDTPLKQPKQQSMCSDFSLNLPEENVVHGLAYCET